MTAATAAPADLAAAANHPITDLAGAINSPADLAAATGADLAAAAADLAAPPACPASPAPFADNVFGMPVADADYLYTFQGTGIVRIPRQGGPAQLVID